MPVAPASILNVLISPLGRLGWFYRVNYSIGISDNPALPPPQWCIFGKIVQKLKNLKVQFSIFEGIFNSKLKRCKLNFLNGIGIFTPLWPLLSNFDFSSILVWHSNSKTSTSFSNIDENISNLAFKSKFASVNFCRKSRPKMSFCKQIKCRQKWWVKWN